MYLLDSIVFEEISQPENASIESVAILIKPPSGSSILLTTIYRPPSAPVEFFTDLESCLHLWSDKSSNLIAIGDFNINTQTRSTNHNHLNDIMNIFGLKQLILTPTRITETSESTIDLILTNCEYLHLHTSVFPCGFSDHEYVYTCLSSKTPKMNHYTKTFRSFKNFNEINFLNELQHQNWQDLYNLTNVDAALTFWTSKFSHICDKFAPYVTGRFKRTLPKWLNNRHDIFDMFHQRDALKVKAYKTKNNIDFKNYRKIRNSVTKLCRDARAMYYKSFLNNNKGNTKTIWNGLKDLLPSKSNTFPPSFSINGSDISDHLIIADSFNSFFTNNAVKLSSLIDASNCPDPSSYLSICNSFFSLSCIDEDFVQTELTSFNPNTSTGPDLIDGKFLKDASAIIAPHLTFIFNLSINSNCLPSAWKTSKVFPIFKSGKRKDLNNYRPISILSLCSEIIEKSISQQIYSYLDSNNLISTSQSGFRPRHSTLTALTNTYDNWLHNINNKKLTGTIFIDLKKAFDTIDHNILLAKLPYYGFSPSTISWLRSYLSNRSQQVLFEKTLSSSGFLSIGVPQGSTLGLLLFSIYINDLHLL
ncbi:uncharacterized protein [Antedon mediterranea]|uniref:uncharacterized protein n=1 Tax=Antedon mediterranea TaxID=105859 RepID=UPI003AF6A319